MRIDLDQKVVEEAAMQSMDAAFREALGSWTVSKAIGEKITESVADGAVGEALDRAIRSIDTEALVASLAESLTQNMVASTNIVIRESLVSTVAKLRGIGDYDGERMAALRAELEGSMRPSGR